MVWGFNRVQLPSVNCAREYTLTSKYGRVRSREQNTLYNPCLKLRKLMLVEEVLNVQSEGIFGGHLRIVLISS